MWKFNIVLTLVLIKMFLHTVGIEIKTQAFVYSLGTNTVSFLSGRHEEK